MRSLLSLFIVVFSLANAAFPQSQVTDIRSAQKDFKKALIRHTNSVYAVDYSGCEASVKVVTGFLTSPTEQTYSSPPQGSAGFPTDTFGPNFGTEPRALGKSIRYLLDLSSLDPDNISIRPGIRKNTSVVTLRVGPNPEALKARRDQKIEMVDSFFVVTPAKSASKTAEAMKNVIERCSAGG